MKAFTITLEVDDVTVRDVEYGIVDMLDNELITSEAVYKVEKTVK